MSRLIVLLIASIACFVSVTAQGGLYSSQQGIEIDYDDKHGVHFVHVVEKGHTLYALSRVFQVPPARILAYNGKARGEAIRLRERLRIPFEQKLLYTGASIKSFGAGTFLPVFYTIKPKETLYRVSRVYFEQDAELILQRNQILGSQLNEGQRLLMGWIPLDKAITLADDSIAQVQVAQQVEGVPLHASPDQQDSAVASLVPDSLAVLAVPLTPVETYKEVSHTGLAYWNKDSADRDNLFVLHSTARINSLIEIFNPQLQRRTFAKVIARIPAGTYPDNIDIIVSPRVAHTLGALNSEFRVKMKFYE